MAILIRPEVSDDVELIDKIVAAAFGSNDEAKLVRLIRERDESIMSLVAESGDEVVGHVMASPIVIDPPCEGVFAGVAPLAVSPECQAKGTGSELMKAVEEVAREKGIDALFLLGSPAYYPRFGYVASHIGNEYGATDAFMHLELTPGILDGVEGTAKYVTAFQETGS